MKPPAVLGFGPARDREIDAVVALWDVCGLTRPHNDPTRDIAFARRGRNSEVLVGRLQERIVTSVMVGHDGHRGCVYYLACAPEYRGRGFGRQTMAAAEKWLASKGVWKLNLMIREGNEQVVGFYRTLGYETEPRIVMSHRLDG